MFEKSNFEMVQVIQSTTLTYCFIKGLQSDSPLQIHRFPGFGSVQVVHSSIHHLVVRAERPSQKIHAHFVCHNVFFLAHQVHLLEVHEFMHAVSPVHSHNYEHSIIFHEPMSP